MATTAPFCKQGFFSKLIRDTSKYQKKPWVVLLGHCVHPIIQIQGHAFDKNKPWQDHYTFCFLIIRWDNNRHICSTWWIDWLSTLARLPWKASVSAWWEMQSHYWVSRCFPADHLPTPGKWKTGKKEKEIIIIEVHLTVMETAVKSEPEVITFFGQMMWGANIVARLIADILLTCWLRAVWYSRSSNNFNRLRLAGGSNMKSSWKASIWRSLSGTFVLFPSSSKRVNSGHSEKKELL